MQRILYFNEYILFSRKIEFIFICNDYDDPGGFNIMTFFPSFRVSNNKILDTPNYFYGNFN